LKISRRTVLRGAAGGLAVGFALPPLEAMFNSNGNALADGAAIPVRMGIFFWGDGVKPDRWVPTTTGAGWMPSPSLQPLVTAGVADYVNVVSGMVEKASTERGHHSGTVGILSGGPLVVQPAGGAPYRSTFTLPSIDQVAANIIGTNTKFKSIETGISTRVNANEGTTLQYLSHTGPDSPNPAEYDPAALYNRIFAMGFTPPGGAPAVADATLGFRKSVLDSVLGDLMNLRDRVSTSDKVRLDKHADNIRTMENRLVTNNAVTMSTACALPMNPGSFMDQNGNEQIAAKMAAMSDLIAMALACDQARVFSMQFTGSVAGTVFTEVNVNGGHHQLTHDEPGDQPMVQATTVYTVQMFAVLLNALKAIPEGAGNLLDNCAILASTDTSDGRFHNLLDYPILIAGKGGGYFKYPGIHYRSPTGDENTSNALLSLLRAAGTNVDSVGADNGLSSTTCSPIEA
ncbi:MAG TPA: DUF1552 domain-containing protein, partial [Polyangiaceae bacterium]|nr:DUF1552 domain-containing protein [Polyangiaceae bacterium]